MLKADPWVSEKTVFESVIFTDPANRCVGERVVLEDTFVGVVSQWSVEGTYEGKDCASRASMEPEVVPIFEG